MEETRTPAEQLQAISDKSGVPCEAIIALAYRAKKQEEKYLYDQQRMNDTKHIEGVKSLIRKAELQKAENDSFEQDIRHVELKFKKEFLNSPDSVIDKQNDQKAILIRHHDLKVKLEAINNPVKPKTFRQKLTELFKAGWYFFHPIRWNRSFYS